MQTFFFQMIIMLYSARINRHVSHMSDLAKPPAFRFPVSLDLSIFRMVRRGCGHARLRSDKIQKSLDLKNPSSQNRSIKKNYGGSWVKKTDCSFPGKGMPDLLIRLIARYLRRIYPLSTHPVSDIVSGF